MTDHVDIGAVLYNRVLGRRRAGPCFGLALMPGDGAVLYSNRQDPPTYLLYLCIVPLLPWVGSNTPLPSRFSHPLDGACVISLAVGLA